MISETMMPASSSKVRMAAPWAISENNLSPQGPALRAAGGRPSGSARDMASGS
jgi:hypothetical protein